MSRSVRFGSGAALALVATLAGSALANSRAPAPTQIHFSPASGNDIYLQTTFGLVESHDAGATWRWVCEEAIGYSGLYDPDYVISSKGSLLATTFDGLKIRRDGCVFEATNLGAKFSPSVTSDASGATLYAGVADAGTKEHHIFKSTDDGKTFVPTGDTTPGDEASWSSIEVAPSDANIVYACGYRFPPDPMPRVVTMYKSVNAGGVWTPLPLTGVKTTTNSSLSVLSISPDDPKLFLLAVSYPDDAKAMGTAIYRTTDGGATFTQVKDVADFITGAVIRKFTKKTGTPANNADVVLGTTANGIFSSTDGGQTFTQSPLPPATISVQCMAEHGGVLWACGNNLPPDAMALGKSPTPDSWTKVLQFKDIKETTQCKAGTVQHDTCEAERWCTFRDQIGITANPTGCISSGADASLVDGPPADGAVVVKGKDKGCCEAGNGATGAITLSLLSVLALTRRGARRASRRRRH